MTALLLRIEWPQSSLKCQLNVKRKTNNGMLIIISIELYSTSRGGGGTVLVVPIMLGLRSFEKITDET